MITTNTKLPGKITISRSSNNLGGDYINIKIQDAGSGITFVEAAVDLKDFTDALFGLGHTPCNLDVRHLDKVGMVREVKLVDVFRPDRLSALRERPTDGLRACMAEHEVDGWIGDLKDLTNHHRRVDGKNTDAGSYYRVTFVRWVEADQQEVSP